MGDDREAQERQWWEAGESPSVSAAPAHAAAAPAYPTAPAPAPPLRQAPAPAISSPTWLKPGGRRFYAVALIIAAPFFAFFCTIVAVVAMPHPGSRVFGIGAAVFDLLVINMAIRYPYVAIVSPDGTLTFKALSGSTSTSTSSVRRITVRTSGRGGSTWYFDYGVGRAHLSDIGGSSLARYLVQSNPGIDCPRRLLKWAPPL